MSFGVHLIPLIVLRCLQVQRVIKANQILWRSNDTWITVRGSLNAGTRDISIESNRVGPHKYNLYCGQIVFQVLALTYCE